MARVTVEDCINHVPNRFELVLLATKRAQELTSGARLTVMRQNDKNPVVALREIGDGTIDVGELRERVLKGLQQSNFTDQEDEDELDYEKFKKDFHEKDAAMMRQKKLAQEDEDLYTDVLDIDD